MSAFSEIVERLRAMVFRQSEERELDEELRLHTELETEYQRGLGLSDTEARRRSLLALGGVEKTKEDVRDARGTRLVEDVASDISFTLRTLGRSPGFVSVVVLTLAIGIGGTTAVFSAVDAVLLESLPYQQPGQLVRLYQPDSSRLTDRMWVSPVHYLAYRSQSSSFESVAAILTYDETGADIGSGDDVRRIRLLPISADYFDVVRVHPEVGAGFQPEDEIGANVVVISHQLWQNKLGGETSAIGKSLTMDGKPYRIAGVMPKGYVDPVAGTIDAWVPLDLSEGKDPNQANNHYLTVIARLRPSLSIQQAQSELNALSLRLAEQYSRARAARARIYSLKEDIVGGSSQALVIMLCGVGLVLILVCVNIANLLLVRASQRAQEFALRSALGADRGRLVRQLLIESLTLAVAGDIAGLVVARLGMSAIVVLGAGRIPRLATLSLDPKLLGFSLIIATLSAVLFGLAPALRAARTQPGDVLRDQSRSATGGAGQIRLREWLVVSQVALAFVLLVGAGVLLASFQRLRQVDLGVKPEAVLTFEVHLPEARYDSTARARFYEDFAQKVEALHDVRAAGGVSRLPATGSYHWWGTRATTGALANTPDGESGGEQRIVSGDYFRAVGIPTLEGRTFDVGDGVGAPDRVVVSRSFAAHLYPGVSAIGQRLNSGGRESEIIGVVGDVSVNNQGNSDFFVYHAHRQFAGDRHWSLTQVVSTTGDPEALVPEIRRTLREFDPGLVMYRTAALPDVIGQGAAQRVFTLRILLTFAAVALALSGLGIFGVLSYGVKLRNREFGIRMALGAKASAIRQMVLRQGLRTTAAGIAIGLLTALPLSRLMASMVFETSPLDPRVLGGAALFMGLVALAAAYLPARRATAVEPSRVLQG